MSKSKSIIENYYSFSDLMSGLDDVNNDPLKKCSYESKLAKIHLEEFNNEDIEHIKNFLQNFYYGPNTLCTLRNKQKQIIQIYCNKKSDNLFDLKYAIINKYTGRITENDLQIYKNYKDLDENTFNKKLNIICSFLEQT
jgi:hypothetical protein